MAMLWQYLGLLLSFAFRRTTLAIDSLQIVAASAIPALSELAGFKMAPDIQNETLAYIGAVAIAWVVLRLLFAPFFIWRDQVGEISTLKLELSKPERIELDRISKIRAKKRLQLAAALREMQLHIFLGNKDPRKIGKCHKSIARLVAYCQPDKAIMQAIGQFQTIVDFYKIDALKGYQNLDETLAQYVNALSECLHGRITTAQCVLQLPPYIEQENPH